MIPNEYVLILAAITFAIGLFGILIRRNLLVMLMSAELVLNSINMIFIVFSKHHQLIDGELVGLFNMTIAAAESAVGLGLFIALFRTLRSVSSESIEVLRD